MPRSTKPELVLPIAGQFKQEFVAQAIADLGEAAFLERVLASKAWEKTVGVHCGRLDANKGEDVRIIHPAEECERVLLAGALRGATTVAEAREAVEVDAALRKAIGFKGRRRRPPVAVLTEQKQALGRQPRRNLYRQLWEALEREWRPRRPKRRRKQNQELPAIPENVQVPYSKVRNPELCNGDVANLLMAHPAYEEIGARLDEIDAQPRRAGKYLFSSREMESALLFGGSRGEWRFTHTLAALRDPVGARRDRRALGFERPRLPDVAERESTVPSARALSQHLGRFDWKERAERYRRLFEALRAEALTIPAVIEECRILYMDTTDVPIQGRAARLNQETGELENVKDAPVMDAGYVPQRKHGAGGDGYKIGTILGIRGAPLVLCAAAINEADKKLALERLLPELRDDVLPLLGPPAIRLMSADALFGGYAVRMRLRSMWIIDNIHASSHANRESTRKNVAKKRADEISIEGTDWLADGHYQLFCKCGQGTVGSGFALGLGGLQIRSDARCERCGNKTFTAGLWKIVQNPPGSEPRKRFVRIEPDDRVDLAYFDVDDENDERLLAAAAPEEEARGVDARLKQLRAAFGNPFTYDDWRSGEYGRRRFGHNEGFYGQFARRWGIIDGKRALRSLDQLNAQLYMVGSLMWATTIYHYQRAELLNAELELAA